ncbi:MAG: HEAT repeat domain-containing protein [Chloroflexi bacterium]|nr:HEAT repeat domain-containing protein [Chloroflexota bacterium]
MRIVVLNHPLDGDFAVRLNLILIRSGLNSRIETLDTVHGFLANSANDELAIIVVLRPQFVNSSNLLSVLELADGSNVPIFPVIRAPIDIHEWPTQIGFTHTIDFTDHDEQYFVAKVFDLAHAVALKSSAPSTPHLSLLETHISNLLLSTQWLDKLEALNFPEMSSQSPLKHFIENIQYDVISTDNPSLKRKDLLAEILLHFPRILIQTEFVDSDILARYITDTYVMKYSGDPRSAQLPIVINLAAWSPNRDSLDSLMVFRKTAYRDIENGKIILIVHGIEGETHIWNSFWEILANNIDLDSPFLSIIILIEEFSNVRVSLEHLVEIKPVEITFGALQKYSSHFPDRLLTIYINTSLENDTSQPLHYFTESPLLFAQLLSIRFSENTQLQEYGVADYYTALIETLWNMGCRINSDKESELQSVYPRLAKMAALLTHHSKIYLHLDDAIKLLGNKYTLQTCIDSGLLTQNGNKIRFAVSHFKNYFASIALREYGLPSKLPKPTLNYLGERIPKLWDKSLILLPHLLPNSTLLLERLAEQDPLLALRAISRGSKVSRNLYLSIVEKALISMHQTGDFRLALANQLKTIDQPATIAILLEIMREGSWTLRTSAYNLLNDFDSSITEDIIPLIKDSEKEVEYKTVVYAIQRIGDKAMIGLIQLLKSDDVVVRKNAIRILGMLQDKVASPALVARLADIHHEIVLEAIKAIGQLKDIQTVLALAQLANYSSSRVVKAIRTSLLQLQQLNPEKFIKYVQELNIVNRYAVVLLLCETNENKNIDFALALSYDNDPDVRIAALNGLRNFRGSRSTLRLEECLNDTEKSNLSKQRVSEIAARLISASGLANSKEKSHTDAQTKPDKRTSSEIVKSRLILAKTPVEAITTGDDEDGYKVVTPIKTEGDLKIATILQQMREQGWNTSNSAAKELREYAKQLQGTANTQVMNQIIEMLNDNDWVMRWAGVETLGWIGNIHVVPHLIQRLADNNWKIRVAAIRALAEIKAESAANAIAESINDSHSVVREAASEALGSLGSTKTIVALEKASNDTEEFVRLAAVESLGRIKDSSTEVPLLSAMKDKSEHVRWAAANALTSIARPQLDTMLIPFLSDDGGPYWEQKRICDVIADILSQINTDKAKSALVEWRNSQSRSVS